MLFEESIMIFTSFLLFGNYQELLFNRILYVAISYHIHSKNQKYKSLIARQTLRIFLFLILKTINTFIQNV